MIRSLAVSLSLMLVACGTTEAPVAPEAPAAPAAPPTSGIDKVNFDAAFRPQDDLYRAVNGAWLKANPIPADKSNYGAFSKLADDSEAAIKAIIDEAAASTTKTPGSDEQKIGDYYASFMDEARADSLGIKPLESELAQIDAVADKAGVTAAMAHLARVGVNVPLQPVVHQDNKDATAYIGDLMQGGLGLPDRDYFVEDTPKNVEIRGKYLKHIEAMLTLAGSAKAADEAKAIVELETRLARASWDKVTNRDPIKTYNKVEAGKLSELTSSVDWPAYLKAVGFEPLPAVIVSQPTYVTALGKELESTSVDTWKAYLRWRLISAYAPLLSKAFVDESFGFYSTTLNGVPENRPRWKRGVALVENGLGEAVGRAYVAKHFTPENKARVEQLVQNLLKAYDEEIGTLAWMSPETQAAAKRKLAKFTPKIGYPNKWRDYSSLEIKPDDLVGNALRGSIFDYDREVAKFGKPIDREEWGMTPQTVNAYYNPEMNEIVFPAAILQPPFFDPAADDAVNYGGIGAVIGHEISHGFDDQGSKYDGDGNLNQWWTDADQAKFEALGNALAAQYEAYEPVAGNHLDGHFTLGENIADLGGLTISHKAYQLSLGGQPAPEIDGLTGDQRFFMGWAQVWRRNYRDENLLTRIKSDPHSPSEFRANGTAVNVPAFYEAFGITDKDKLYRTPEQRIAIW